MKSGNSALLKTMKQNVGPKKITLTGFYDQGGQNKIYRGKMTVMDSVEGVEKTIEVICKTA
jgi:hypothetical protein